MKISISAVPDESVIGEIINSEFVSKTATGFTVELVFKSPQAPLSKASGLHNRIAKAFGKRFVGAVPFGSGESARYVVVLKNIQSV